MAISGISGSTGVQANSAFQQRRNDFQALSKALQSGDLAGAQQAFASLQQDGPKRAQNAQNGSGGDSKVGDAFKALGQALQSGDLAGAQQAFASLQQTMQGAQGHHHHHHGAEGSTQSTATTATTTATTDSGSSTGIDVTA